MAVNNTPWFSPFLEYKDCKIESFFAARCKLGSGLKISLIAKSNVSHQNAWQHYASPSMLLSAKAKPIEYFCNAIFKEEGCS